MNGQGSGISHPSDGGPIAGGPVRDQGPKIKGYRSVVIILSAAGVAVTPQLIRGNSCGHDFDFHLVSWLDCLNSWRHGILYPHWTPSANFGAGEPRFVFYPPLTWMLGAALGVVLPWTLVPIALTWVLLAATGLATRALALEAVSDGAATLAGCMALFSGYALFCSYERSAFGELTGGFWIPLLLLLVLRDRNAEGTALWRAFDGSAFPLALVVAGAWLSNVPVGIMACYLLAAVALAASVLSKSWAPALRAAVSAALGIGLAAIYLVPAVWEQRWIDVRQVTGDAGEMIENSWLFAHNANPLLELHDQELRRVSIIAAVMIALALAGILVFWLRSRGDTEKQPADILSVARRFWIPLALIPVAILLLQLPVSLPVWNLLPKLRLLQFPWRWLMVLEAPMAVIVASAIWPSRRSGGRWPRVAVASACAVVFMSQTAISGLVFFQVCDDEDAVKPMLDVYRTGAGFQGTDEYAPPGADNSMVASGLPFACLVSNPSVVLGVTPGGQLAEGAQPAWDPAQGSCQTAFAPTTDPRAAGRWDLNPEHLRIFGTTSSAGFLILRLRSYPAWQVMLNGRRVAAMPARADGLMVVPVPRGAVELTADWTTTPDVVAGRWLSGLVLVLITGLCLLERKLSRPRLS
ncbi:MAG: 6-pyruvoyl-tetrahydropterin synthase-related protein [Terracidiphilus sp.]